MPTEDKTIPNIGNVWRLGSFSQIIQEFECPPKEGCLFELLVANFSSENIKQNSEGHHGR